MVLPRNTSYITFGLILLGAILVLVSGVFLARKEIRVPVEQNQLPLTRFTATLLEEIESLDSLYLNHLQDLNELIGPNSTRIEIASFCREVVGIEQATLLEEGEPPRHLDLRTEGRDESLPLPLPHRLGDGVEYDGLLVDTKPLEGFNPQPNYYITGSPDDHLFFVGKCFYNTILVLRLDPEAIRISGLAWMKQWSNSAILPLQESGLQVEVRAPSEEIVASSLIGREKAAPDFLLPIPSRVGDWQLAAWNETKVITSYHLPVLIGSAALFVVVALAGFFGFGQQLKAIRVAEQRVSFANRVSHELRTPMTNILLNTDLLSDAIPVEETSTRKRLDLVRDEANRLSRLVENVLTFSRRDQKEGHSDAGERDFLGQYIDLKVAIENVIAQFSLSFSRLGIEVRKNYPAGDVGVAGDIDSVSQIISNLVSNVEKYASKNGVLEITVRSSGDIVSMTVSDDGPGISDAKRDQVFLPFERVNDATTEGVSGTGLGLAISRELAESMGGGLILEPDPDSTLAGAHFTMTLPAALSNIVPIAS